MPLPNTMNRWIEGLASGLYAQALATIPLRSEDSEDDRVQVLKQALAAKLDTLGASDDTILLCLPISTLRALSHPFVYPRLPGGKANLKRIQTVINQLTMSPGKGLPPPLSAAAVLAHLCLSGFAGAGSIVRCGNALVGSGWDIADFDDWRDTADLHLNRLRNRDSAYPVDSLGQIEELEKFHQAIPRAEERWHWELVENTVFHQLHDWPLVVDSEREAPGEDPVRFGVTGIPVLVDLVFDGKSKVHLDHMPGGPLVATDWHAEIGYAREVAVDLWRSQHGAALPDFRDRVLSVSVNVDFRVAEAVLAAGPVPIDVTDRSMGPMFAQVILHRLVGRTVNLDSAITGTLGQKIPNRLDYLFERAGGIDRKLVHIFRSQQFAKAVLSDAEPDVTKKQALQVAKQAGGRTEVNYCYRLSDVADAVQFGAWRRKRYMNCPDVRRLIHAASASDELLDYSSAEVDRVRALLAGSTKAVLRVPRDISPLALVTCLYHIDRTERNRLEKRPASLTWSICRAVEDQSDLRFWAKVWDQIGASRSDFHRFRHSSTQKSAAAKLAEALNTFSPRESCLTHAAPDLLVVMADKRMAPDDWKTDAGSYRTFLFPALVEELGKRLDQTSNEGLRSFIGKTRIILLEHGEADVGRPPSGRSRLSDQDRNALSRLGVFRFGFTQQMAAIALEDLDIKGSHVRDSLLRLVDGGHLYRMGGEYWRAGEIGIQDSTTKLSEDEQARRHWAAAKALAPYLSSSITLGAVPEQSFHLDTIHEAAFHLEVGGDLANNARRDAVSVGRKTGKWNPALRELQALHKDIREAHGRLLAFLEIPSIGIVTWLSRDRAGVPPTAAWDIARDQLRESKALKVNYSAQQRAVYASAGTELLDDRRDTRGLAIDRARIADDALREFTEALQQAVDDPRGNIRLSALTHYGLFLWKINMGINDRVERLAKVREEVAKLVGAGIRSAAIQSRWFEIEGDQHEDPSIAATQYEVGFRMSPVYGANCVKLAGVAKDPALVQQIVQQLRSRDLLAKTLRWARTQDMPIRSGLDVSWMEKRWSRGVRSLEAASRS